MTDPAVINVNGLSVAFSDFEPRDPAAGLPILALHGWGASRQLIAPAAERLAARGHRVVAPDLPGFGDTPAPDAPWSVGDYAAFVVALLHALNLGRVHLFGHSFGGRISLVLGADHASMVGKLVLADSAGVPPKQPWHTQARLKSYRAARKTLEAAGAKRLSGQLRTWYAGRYGSADYQQTSGVMRDTFVRVVNEDLRPFAARARQPALLFWGDRDEDTPLWQGKSLESIMPDAGLVVLAGAGHYSYLDKLDEFVRVTDFFLRQEGAAAT